MESCSSCSIHISCCCVKIPKKVRSVVDRQTLIFFFFESVNSWSFLCLLTPAGNLPLLCICVCKYTVMHTHKHIRTVSSWEDEWPEVELPVKDSLGTGSLAHTYTHILLSFFSIFDVQHCVVVRVFSVSCDQARPPAGDLGRGGAVLEEKKMEKRGVLLLWEAGEGKRGTVCYSSIRNMMKFCSTLCYDSLSFSPSFRLESTTVL